MRASVPLFSGGAACLLFVVFGVLLLSSLVPRQSAFSLPCHLPSLVLSPGLLHPGNVPGSVHSALSASWLATGSGSAAVLSFVACSCSSPASSPGPGCARLCRRAPVPFALGEVCMSASSASGSSFPSAVARVRGCQVAFRCTFRHVFVRARWVARPSGRGVFVGGFSARWVHPPVPPRIRPVSLKSWSHGSLAKWVPGGIYPTWF